MYLNVLLLSDLEKGSSEAAENKPTHKPEKLSRETVLSLNLSVQFAGWMNLCKLENLFKSLWPHL